MRTEKGHFGFLHSWDFLEMIKASERGDGPTVTRETSTECAYIVGSTGERTNLIVSDCEERGTGIADEPSEQTVKVFKRHNDFVGRPLPWL